MKVFGSNVDGLNRFGNSRYSASLMPAGVGFIMGQEASTLASEYGPQWMNMPNLASRYQRVRSFAKLEPNPRLGTNGSDDPASASLMKSRRDGEQALTRAEMLSRHLLAQKRSGSVCGTGQKRWGAGEERSLGLAHGDCFDLSCRSGPTGCSVPLKPVPERLHPAHSKHCQPDVDNPRPSAWVSPVDGIRRIH